MTFEKQHPSQMPTALEAGTLNGHGIAGLRAALLYIKEQGMEHLRKREQQLSGVFMSRQLGNSGYPYLWGFFPERQGCYCIFESGRRGFRSG